MNKVHSASTQMGFVLLITVSIVLFISFVVIFNTPTPAPQSVSIATIAKVLKAPETAEMLWFQYDIQAQPPSGKRVVLFEAVMARELQLPKEQVQISVPELQRVKTVFTVGAGVEVLESVSVTSADFDNSPLLLSILSTQNVLSSFTAAMQLNDGRWAVISPKEPFWSGWRVQMVIAFVISLLLLCPVGWFAARYLTQPLRDLALIADYSDINESPAIKPAGPSEVRVAAIAIENMHARLLSQSADREHMVTAIAHDLRTPLTSLRIRVESAPENERLKMVSDISRMEAMITEMLAFSSGASNDKKQIPLNLVTLIQQHVEQDSVHSQLTVGKMPEMINVCVNELEIQRALTNLIDNAQKYAGSAHIDVELCGDRVVIDVIDNGPGVAEQDLIRLLGPFERGEQSRNRSTGGTGLGLTIVNDIAIKHGGEFHLENRVEGGLRAVIKLPLAQA